LQAGGEGAFIDASAGFGVVGRSGSGPVDSKNTREIIVPHASTGVVAPARLAQTAGASAALAVGGAGLVATGNVSVTTSGSIGGGLNVDGSARADAIDFSGGGNTLTIENGSSFLGNVVSAGGDTLALGGDRGSDGGTGDGSFDLAQIGNSAQFEGFANFAKTGTSAWTLSGTDAALAWDVSAGTLQVDGGIGDVTVDGGVLGGIGSVGAITLDNGGAVAPGDSPGTLNGAGLIWNGGGVFNFQLGATNTTADTDLLALSGTLTKGTAGTYVFHFSDGNGAPQVGVSYTLITFGSYAGFAATDFTFDYAGANGGLSGTFLLTANALTFTPSSTKAATTTTLSSACMTTFVESQPFTVDARTTGASPTGSVAFNDETGALCSNVVLSGASTASCTTSAWGVQGAATQSVYHVTASYSGDGNNKPSDAPSLVVTVLNAADVIFRNGLEVETLSCPIE
jgi:hypothetical protein